MIVDQARQHNEHSNAAVNILLPFATWLHSDSNSGQETPERMETQRFVHSRDTLHSNSLVLSIPSQHSRPMPPNAYAMPIASSSKGALSYYNVLMKSAWRNRPGCQGKHDPSNIAQHTLPEAGTTLPEHQYDSRRRNDPSKNQTDAHVLKAWKNRCSFIYRAFHFLPTCSIRLSWPGG